MSQGISPRACAAFEQIFIKALKATARRSAEDRCTVMPLGQDVHPQEGRDPVLVLTISSFRFRLLVIFHLSNDPALQAYFTAASSDRPFRESFAEFGNLCCGAMNRELLNYFPHLGMSTPDTLSGQCLESLQALAPQYVLRHRVVINDAIHLPATLCICGFAPVDFSLDRTATETVTGELELF